MILRELAGAFMSAAGVLVVAATVLPSAMQLLPQGAIRLLPRSLQSSYGLPEAALLTDLKHQDEIWKRTISHLPGAPDLGKMETENKDSLPSYPRAQVTELQNRNDDWMRKLSGTPGAPDLGKLEAEYKDSLPSYPPAPPPPKPASPRKQPVKAQPSPPAPKLYDGRILFEPERTMQLRHAEVVMVRMDAGASPDLEAGIDPKHYKVDPVEVGRRMRVHLDGDPPDAFEIVPMLPPDEEQAVTNLSASTWMWNVTPKKNGAAALLLHIWALAKVEDSDTLVPLFQKTETIHVRGIPLPEVNAGGFLEKVLEGVGEHTGEAIAVLIGAGLMGLGGRIAKWWRKPKSAAAAAPAAGTP